MTDPEMIIRIIEAVWIPVMAKARITTWPRPSPPSLGVDYSTSPSAYPRRLAHHIDK